MSLDICEVHDRLRCADCLEKNGLREENARLRGALEKIAKMPDLPNPERDADWRSCMKWASHYAKQALEDKP